MNDYSSKGTLKSLHQALDMYEGKRYEAVEQNDIESVRRYQKLINETQGEISELSVRL